MAREKHLATSVRDLAEGPQRVTVDDKKLLLYRSEDDETVYAFRNVCPHQLGPVVEGKLDVENKKVICPWHGWEFDLEGGTNPFGGDLAKRLPQVETVVEDEDVYVLMQ
ncbi:Rieske (2Fe-2S) protein [Natronomonas marina]|uniref:Rieske (2Fe-2S) protein n=1 Tax=Natronomonas marina TaxID=2961939 RepID=UPI0020C952C2|nr:Rieske (2Fe-2S) protein [Natronomonas marina]